MKKAEIGTVTRENFAEYEKKVWRAECRRAKAKAGAAAGGFVGDVVFVLALIGVLSYSFESKTMELSLLGKLGELWIKICVMLWEGTVAKFYPVAEDTDSGYVFMVCVIVSFLAPLILNVLTNIIVYIVWPKVKLVPLSGNGSLQAEALYQRSEKAREPIPFCKWYLIPTIAFTVAYIVEMLKTGGVDELKQSPIFGFFTILIMILIVALAFMLAYLLYRGLSRPIVFLLGKQKYTLSSVLHVYVNECKRQEKEEEERRLAEEKRQKEEKKEQDRLRGDEIYRKATAGNKVDEELIARAAELGSRPACLYMGRKLMEAWGTGTYTREEKKELMQAAKEYFYIASQEKNFPESQIEAAFGYKMVTVLLMEAEGDIEYTSPSEWKKILSELKAIRASRKLPERYNEACVQLIDYVSDMREAAKERKTRGNTIYLDSDFYNRVAARVAQSGYGTGSGYAMGSTEWNRMHDDLDAVERSLGGPGWSDGV